MTATASELFKVYEEYSKTLRTWLVAYGIGAPVLFLTNERLSKALFGSGQTRFIASWFLTGVILQVFLAVLNKNLMWACYYREEKPELKSSYLFNCADRLSRQYWLDLLVDSATMIVFAVATWRAFHVVVAAS